jgi:hypothetical protein
MTPGFLLLIGGLVFLSGSAVAAFCWSVKDCQLTNPRAAALTIFDEDEPVGMATDKFPSRQ